MLTFRQYITEKENSCSIVTREQMKQFENFVDRLFKKYGIDFEFTKHFRERMGDERNDPCISIMDLGKMFKKMYEEMKPKQTFSKYKDAEIVIKDIQNQLNMPVVVNYDPKKDEFDIVAKTVMRKKNFTTPSPVVKV
jgi:hypothetical protein